MSNKPKPSYEYLYVLLPDGTLKTDRFVNRPSPNAHDNLHPVGDVYRLEPARGNNFWWRLVRDKKKRGDCSWALMLSPDADLPNVIKLAAMLEE